MANSVEAENEEIGRRWCKTKGEGWSIVDIAGRGGTAPVFTVLSPKGTLALKILDKEFSSGERRDETEKRVRKQVEAIGEHDCPYLVKVIEGGPFEDRFYVLMNKAEGNELEKKLADIPRAKIRSIVDQVARACLFLRDRNLCHRDIKSANVFISDDFERATLLDVSVVRDIHDPIGMGTDDGGRLPVVATSRYSPPEYLFRLHEPTPEIWHALDVYQLGGLIHDLVMKQPMFESDYQLSRDNRYRFAWIVATQTPIVEASDVDGGLLLLAKRALDKDWSRRAKLTLQDFFSDTDAKIKIGLSALGFAVDSLPVQYPTYADKLTRLNNIIGTLEEFVSSHLDQNGLKARHSRIPRARLSSDVKFEWQTDELNPAGYTKYALTFELSISLSTLGVTINRSAVLLGMVADGSSPMEVRVALPDIADGDEATAEICKTSVNAIGILASMLLGEG